MSERIKAWRFPDGHEMIDPPDSVYMILRLPDGTYHCMYHNDNDVDLEELLPLLGWTQDAVEEET